MTLEASSLQNTVTTSAYNDYGKLPMDGGHTMNYASRINVFLYRSRQRV